MNDGVVFLQTELKDGYYASYASPRQRPFQPVKKQPAIFSTILILDALANVPGTAELRGQLAAFLKAQTTPAGIWNYWKQGTSAARNEPYPDDLDDTACALAALQPYGLDAATIGHFAHALVACESQPGGPYNTWVIDTAQAPQWRHIDVVVNANIGYALARQNVTLANLNDYIATQLAQKTLASPYYVGELPTVYFLSRWYDGLGVDVLRATVRRQLQAITGLNSLELALLLSSALRLKVDLPLARLAEKLRVAQTADGSWPAAVRRVDV